MMTMHCVKRLRVCGERVEVVCDRETGQPVPGAVLFANASKGELLGAAAAERLFGDAAAGVEAVASKGQLVDDAGSRSAKRDAEAAAARAAEEAARGGLCNRFTGEPYTEEEFKALLQGVPKDVRSSAVRLAQYLCTQHFECVRYAEACIVSNVDAAVLDTSLAALPASAYAVSRRTTEGTRLLLAVSSATQILAALPKTAAITRVPITPQELTDFSEGTRLPAPDRKEADAPVEEKKANKNNRKKAQKAKKGPKAVERYEAEVSVLPLKKLADLCRAEGLSTSGKQADLVERLVCAFETINGHTNSEDSD